MNPLRQALKKHALTHNLFTKVDKLYFSFLYEGSPVLASKYIYRRITGKILNLKNPKDFNEKLQWLKLYWQNPLISKCTDKYEVREYAEKSGYEKILNQIYGVYEKSSEINWDELPKKFALKCTHGCGFNIICDDKDKLDKDQTMKQLDEWMKIRLDKCLAEVQYSKIKPRIICEQYLETDQGFLPIDYKVHCFNGKAKAVLVCTDRDTKLKLKYMNLNWEDMNFEPELFAGGSLPKKPECLNEMIKYAEILSKPFPFVRIDFYDYKGKPILGEMTFTPGACIGRNYNEAGIKYFGQLVNLPTQYDAYV